MAKSPRAKKLPYQCYLKMKLNMGRYTNEMALQKRPLDEATMEEICFWVFKEAVDEYHRSPFLRKGE
jgi:hypothetical protein